MPALALYWDANNFLSYINGVPERLPVLDGLLYRATAGDAVIYTSALSQVEVAFAATERLQRALDPQTEQRIDQLWADPKTITVVDYHIHIGREARSLMRNAMTERWRLSPMDAIHLATALWLRQTGIPVAEFHTYDRDLIAYAAIDGVAVCEPHIIQPNLANLV